MQPGRTALRGLAGFAAAFALRAVAEPSNDVTVMDPVFVEDSTGTPWQYFSTPEFEFLSHCPERFTRAYALALEESTAARLAFLPARYWGDVPTPMSLILYNREPAQTDGFHMRSPIDLAWSGEIASPPESIVLTHPLVIGDGDSFISAGNYWSLVDEIRDLTVDPDSEARLMQRAPRLPAWFVAGIEGPTGVYFGHRIVQTPTGKQLVLAAARWSTEAATRALRAAAIDEKRPHSPPALLLLPVEDLFNHQVPNGQEDLWNAEAALLVRWGLYAGPDREAFLRLVDDAAARPMTEDLLQRELHLSYAGLRQRLVAYVLPAVANPVTLPLPAQGSPTLRDANPTEVARILGDWGRLEGQSLGLQDADYQDECLTQADKQFRNGHLSRTRDPRFLASYGLYALQRGDRAGAREALEQAVAAGVNRPKAYVELARLRLEAALPMYPKGRGDLEYDDLTGVLDLLTAAHNQMPSLQTTYKVMARAWDHAPRAPTLSELEPLRQAQALFPADVPFGRRIAKIYADNGYREEASDIVADALRFANTAAERSFLSSVTEK